MATRDELRLRMAMRPQALTALEENVLRMARGVPAEPRKPLAQHRDTEGKLAQLEVRLLARGRAGKPRPR